LSTTIQRPPRFFDTSVAKPLAEFKGGGEALSGELAFAEPQMG
jgi:hypothetical protein